MDGASSARSLEVFRVFQRAFPANHMLGSARERPTTSGVSNSVLFNRMDIIETMNIIQAPVGALKMKDAAQYLGGVSLTTVRRLIKRGLIKPNRALRHILIPVAELDRFLAGRHV